MQRSLIVALIAIYQIGFTQKPGQYTYAFLNIPQTAKLSAIGGYNISSPDVQFTASNPAILSNFTQQKIIATYNNYFVDINNGYLFFNLPATKYGYFGTSFTFFNYGKFIAADEYGNILGKFTAADYMPCLSWAYAIDTLISIGINVKPIFSKYENYTSFGIGTDIALLYTSPNKYFNAGLVFRNLGKQLKPYTKGNYEKLPTDIQLGFSQKLPHSPFTLSVTAHHLNDFNFSQNNSPKPVPTPTDTPQKQSTLEQYADLTMRHIVASAEINISKSLYIAVGYNYQRRQELKVASRRSTVGFSLGLGLNVGRMSFTYSLAKYHLAANNHVFSLVFVLNEKFKE